MDADRIEDDARIRDRAHAIWEREGQPEGRAAEHWEQAARELASEGAATEAARSAAAGKLKVSPNNDPTRPGGPVEGGAYPDQEGAGGRKAKPRKG